MKQKAILGSVLLGLTIILLTMSGSFTQAQMASSQINQTTLLDPDIFIEDMKIVAGIDAAALIEMILIGNPLPAIASNPLFINVESWLFVASDQDNYVPYMLRRPLRAPENATLMLEMKGSLGADTSLERAVQIALLFVGAYDVGLRWARAEVLPNGNYLYYFTGGMENTLFNTLITEIKGDVTSGFASLLDAATVSASPVKAVVIGETIFEGFVVPVRGVYFIDPAAIAGTSDFTLSTDNIFDSTPVAPMIGLKKFSSLRFRFPYTINPISIDPRPNNFAPQISGKMDWVLKSPWSPTRPAGNYEVVYNIDHTTLASTPRVAVNMAYNQTMLNEDGRLQMDYFVENTGTEDAQNIDITFPVSADFLNFINNLPLMPVLKPDIIVDDTFYTEINATITLNFSGDLFLGQAPITYTQTVLVLDGWYLNTSDGTYVDWDPLLTDIIVKTDSEPYSASGFTGTVDVEAHITHNAGEVGLSNILINEVTNFLAPIDLSTYTINTILDVPGAITAMYNDYTTEAWAAVDSAGQVLYDLIYDEIEIFVIDWMNFGYSIDEMGEVGDTTIIDQVLINCTIPYLAAGDNTTVSWAMYNIPSYATRYGIMGIGTTDVGTGYPAIQLTTTEQDGVDLMRLLFGVFDDLVHPLFTFSRPLSYYDIWSNTWLSSGIRFRYEDLQNFEFYGFSNGLNLQVADDEAVLNVNVVLDATGYQVGDPVEVTYTIENTGDIAAENVKVYLVHGRIGNDWQIVDPEIFWYDDVGQVLPGEVNKYVGTANVYAASFLGIHPVYAIVEFDSDYGQTDLSDVEVDFGPGLHSIFLGAAQTHQVVLSNMAWAILKPATENREPAFPQPVLQIDVEAQIIIPDDAPWELEITITITNIGDETTHITAFQYYNSTEMELLSKERTKGIVEEKYVGDMGIVIFKGITLAPQESVTITMRWKFLFSQGCYIPGIRVVYDSRFENELGGDDGLEGDVEPANAIVMAMNGESAEEDNDWEDYGESTQTSSSAGADVFTGGDHTRRMGSTEAILWSISAIFVTAVAVTIKKKIKH